MNLKTAVAGASLVGAMGLTLLGMTPALANAAPCPQAGQCGPGPGAPGPRGQGGPGPAARPQGDFHPDAGRPPGDFNRGGPPGDFNRGGPPGDFNRGGPPGDFNRGGPPGDFNRGGPGDFNRGGPRPPDAFRGFRNAPWGDGPAPWGWGAPPPPAYYGPPLQPWGPPPPPINYWGYNEQPVWNQGFNQWGFDFFGIWVPLPFPI